MPRQSKTSRHTIASAETERRAIALRKAGASYPQIADQLGIATSTAYQAVKRSIERTRNESAEDAEQVLAIELERLDEAQAHIWGQVRAGDLRAIDTLLRIMERRARYLGLDASEARQAAAAEATAAAQAAQTDWLYQILSGVLDQLDLTDEQAARAPQIIADRLDPPKD